MSKTSKNRGTVSTVKVNGVPKLTTYVDKYGSSSSNYTMSPWEKLAFEYAEKEFAQNLENINVFSEETLKSLSNQVDAYTKSGIKKIDEVYAPMIKNLQNDVASRFGNLDNSIFLDKLSSNNLNKKKIRMLLMTLDQVEASTNPKHDFSQSICRLLASADGIFRNGVCRRSATRRRWRFNVLTIVGGGVQRGFRLRSVAIPFR